MKCNLASGLEGFRGFDFARQVHALQSCVARSLPNGKEYSHAKACATRWRFASSGDELRDLPHAPFSPPAVHC
jgi:hypothetical protein